MLTLTIRFPRRCYFGGFFLFGEENQVVSKNRNTSHQIAVKPLVDANVPQTFVDFRVCEVDEQVSARILEVSGCLDDVGVISMLFSRQHAENAQFLRQSQGVTPPVIKVDGDGRFHSFLGGSILTHARRGKPGFRRWNCCNPLTV